MIGSNQWTAVRPVHTFIPTEPSRLLNSRVSALSLERQVASCRGIPCGSGWHKELLQLTQLYTKFELS